MKLFKTAMKQICIRTKPFSRKFPLILAAGAALATSGCGKTMSDLGFIGMDSSLNERFTAICSSTNPVTVIYQDNQHAGDRYRVQVEGDRRAFVEGSIKNGMVHFSGYYNGQYNPYPGPETTMGVSMGSVQITGDATSAPDAYTVKTQMIRPAAFKALDDINFKRIMPGRPCETLAYGGARNSQWLHPSGY